MIQKDIFSELKKFEQNSPVQFLKPQRIYKKYFSFPFSNIHTQTISLLIEWPNIPQEKFRKPTKTTNSGVDRYSVQIKLTNNCHFQRDPQWPESPMNNIEKNTRTVSLFSKEFNIIAISNIYAKVHSKWKLKKFIFLFFLSLMIFQFDFNFNLNLRSKEMV